MHFEISVRHGFDFSNCYEQESSMLLFSGFPFSREQHFHPGFVMSYSKRLKKWSEMW